VEAAWRLQGRTAVIEMALASGLELAGGPTGNDALNATTAGTGELIARAIEQGARTVVVGLGGSATTDGGLGAVDAIGGTARVRSIDLQVACDVRTRFVDAAPVFAPQKGASPAEVNLLAARLNRVAEDYVARFGVDVRDVDGTGAAGGLAGGLFAIGGRLIPGFDLVADHVDLHDRVEAAEVVVTGEGHLDRQSLDGKVVGGMLELAGEHGLPVIVITGEADPEARDEVVGTGATVVSLIERFGDRRPFDEPRWCVERAARDVLAGLSTR
jgi:glycerate kinase